jgi:arylsulfatase A-like enzyme
MFRASRRICPLMFCLVLGCGEPPPASLLLVTLDTTRVDHLSCFGYERATTPQLEKLAARAVRFRRAWSTSSWTLPAHASLFTGLYPSRHGAHYHPAGDADLGDLVQLPVARYVRAGSLPEEVTTLAEIVAARGYRTGAFVAGPWLHESFGVLQGFQTRDDEVQGFGGRPAAAVTDSAISWLRDVPEEAPYLLFANYFDPHAPYEPVGTHPDLPRASESFRPDYDALMRGEQALSDDERAILRDRYDAEIREMDRQLGRLLEAVLRRPDADRTLIIVTADHGESLGEEGRFGHGFWLSEELVRVPLLVRFAGDRNAGTWNDAPVQLVDLLPLVAAELSLELPKEVEGVLPGERQLVFAELHREQTTSLRFGAHYDRDLSIAIDWPHKLERSDDGGETLSRVGTLLLREVPASDEAIHRRLARALDVHAAARPAATVLPAEIDPGTVEALRRLGYLD